MRYQPGQWIKWIVAQPGNDLDDAVVVLDDGGEMVTIRFKVYGRGKEHVKAIRRSLIVTPPASKLEAE